MPRLAKARSFIRNLFSSRRRDTDLDQEVRLGYWRHVEFDWTDAIRTAARLSEMHSLNMIVRGMDLFHVSVAIEIGADKFLSFDDEQNMFARAAGLAFAQ